jgi:hypothetical protein
MYIIYNLSIHFILKYRVLLLFSMIFTIYIDYQICQLMNISALIFSKINVMVDMNCPPEDSCTEGTCVLLWEVLDTLGGEV